jgi:hypothetical protein
MKQLELSNAEYEQIIVDIENSRDEFTELSRTVDWFCTDMPERLDTCLAILRRAK